MTHACLAPPWCPECLTLLKHWGAKKSTSPALLADLLKAHAMPSREITDKDGKTIAAVSEASALAVLSATRQSFDLPPVIPRHTPRYAFPFTPVSQGYNPPEPPPTPHVTHKRREVAVGASHPPRNP